LWGKQLATISVYQARLKGFYNAFLERASADFCREFKRRNEERIGRKLEGFVPEEEATAEALARTIVPSEQDSPGVAEVGGFGLSVGASLNELCVEDLWRRGRYFRGLASFDVWGAREYGKRFVELAAEEQVAVFRAAEERFEKINGSASAMGKVGRRLAAFKAARHGVFFACMLYPVIRSDCMQVFYTSPVSWKWLGYDGPPMGKGYADLRKPR
jgi:Gluconate 2-dehydrogenase subunit 3